MTGNTSVFNMHTAGWVIMLVGLVGLLLPRRTAAGLAGEWWCGAPAATRAAPTGPSRRSRYRRTSARNPGTARIEAGLPARPTLLTERQQGLDDPIEDAENQAPVATQPTAAPPRTAPQTEVIEDLYENPE